MDKRRSCLIYVPIIHSQEDMGTLGGRLPTTEAYRRLAQNRWAEIQDQVQALSLDWPKVKVYQDGLPDAGPEVVKRILAEARGANYDLLRWLVAQGAEVVGTESPALVQEEYELLKAVYAPTDAVATAKARRRYAERAPVLLAERDAYIVRRIADTLPPGGVGVLFLGEAHRVVEQLLQDIAVEKLPYRHGAQKARPESLRK